MTKVTRRRLITTGVVAAAGATGIAAADRIAQRYGLVPPDSGRLYGLGETLTYASQRLITRHSLAREFPRSQIAPKPVIHKVRKPSDEFLRLQAGGFVDWKLTVDGMVSRPTTFSLADIKGLPTHNQITALTCEEGWNYIAEWIGTPLSAVLAEVGVHPDARAVVYRAIDPRNWDSMDMADALHPQTFLTYGMNDADLPVPSGGPLRIRLPRQLGYKNVKFINRITVTDSLKNFAGGPKPAFTYSWYAGI